jgi:ceramide glucosyltransferase
MTIGGFDGLLHPSVMDESSIWRSSSEMTALILAAGTFCILASAAHCTSLFTVMARVRRQRTSAPQAEVGVSILRPLCGIENFSEATLRSTFHLDHRRYEILFCVASGADPIVPIAQRLIAAHPEIPARLLVGADRISSNPKLNNLVKGCCAASYPWIVMADSNVLMPADYLRRLLQTWQSDTGVVSSPAIGCMPHNFWGELECGFLNTYQARWQCFADEVGLGFVQGKNMLFNKAFLAANGGMRALASELAEDAAATKLARRRGLRARVVDKPFVQPLGRRTAAEVWQRQIRWARLRRDTFPLYFLPKLLTGALPPLAACIILADCIELPVAGIGTVFLALWYGLEAVATGVAGWHLSWRSPLVWALRDAVLPVLWIAAWAGKDFEWRGNSMTIADQRSLG